MKSNFTLFWFVGVFVLGCSCFVFKEDLPASYLRTLNQLAIHNEVRPKILKTTTSLRDDCENERPI